MKSLNLLNNLSRTNIKRSNIGLDASETQTMKRLKALHMYLPRKLIHLNLLLIKSLWTLISQRGNFKLLLISLRNKKLLIMMAAL